MKKWTLLLAMAVLFFLLVPSAGGASIPLPEDLKISPPVTGLPPEVMAFFGQTGKWGKSNWTTREGWQGPEATLIFEEIASDGLSATVVYAWQEWPKWKLVAGWIRVRGNFNAEEGKIIFTFSSDPQSRTKFQFEIKRGKLEGYFPRNYPSYIQMKPMP